jgi:DNA-nicking Smr family endonuclease
MDQDDEFGDAMSGVVPLKQATKVPVAPPLRRRRIEVVAPKVVDDPNKLTLGHVPEVGSHDTLAWKQDGVQERVFRKLKQGEYEIRGELDLHRKTVKEARVAVYEFLKLGIAKGWRTVLIAHGRGEKSPTPARMKSYVAAWLTASTDVIAFHSAQRQRGGTGAVYVLLRKSSAEREQNRERHGQKSDDQMA